MFWIALQPRPEADTEAPLPDDARAALGWWALQFTPRVALQAQAVLLEVSASERLFGGREPLLAHLLQSPRPVAAVQLAHAPTALLAHPLLPQPQGHRLPIWQCFLDVSNIFQQYPQFLVLYLRYPIFQFLQSFLVELLLP